MTSYGWVSGRWDAPQGSPYIAANDGYSALQIHFTPIWLEDGTVLEKVIVNSDATGSVMAEIAVGQWTVSVYDHARHEVFAPSRSK